MPNSKLGHGTGNRRHTCCIIVVIRDDGGQIIDVSFDERGLLVDTWTSIDLLAPPRPTPPHLFPPRRSRLLAFAWVLYIALELPSFHRSISQSLFLELLLLQDTRLIACDRSTAFSPPSISTLSGCYHCLQW